jgi:hypothetical protein
MPEQNSPEPTEVPRPDEARLPIPAPDRRPAGTTADATGLTRLATRTVATGPVLAATVLGAATAAAVTGAAVAARLLWPWVTASRPNLPQPTQPTRPVTSSSGWSGPTVYFRYTSIEIHWPGQP